MSKTLVNLEDVINLIYLHHKGHDLSPPKILLEKFQSLPQESKDEWIDVIAGWPKTNGWYLTKRKSNNGNIKYSADWFLTTHPGECSMEETGWHNVVEYKLIEVAPPTK